MWDFILLINIIIVGSYLISQSRKKDPKKIFNIYSQPGKWYYIKYLIFLAILNLRRIRAKLTKGSLKNQVLALEKLQPLSNHELAFDAIFFQFVSQRGIYFCCGMERRQQGKINGLIYLVIPEYGILESERLPKTTMKADPISVHSQKMYSAEGLVISPIEPMKLWKLNYKGRMKLHSNPDKFVNVNLEAEWKSDYPWFLFEVDMPSRVLARAIARETWTRDYFNDLKNAHQTHYEQMGYLSGTLTIDGNVTNLTDVDAFRDHSFGFKRDWSLMHRYIYHMFYLENGIKISCGVVCQPCTSSYLEMGYVNHPEGRIDPIESCDLLLYQHAENGILPKELCFSVTAKSVIYEIKVTYEYDAVHYKGINEEARMCERFHRCVVNGVPGRGISEWVYNENHMK